MKKIATLFSFLILGLYFSAIVLSAASAQHVDPISVAGDHYKVIMENERVRVMDFTAKAGDKIPAHWHPDHVVYMISGGKAKFTVEGKIEELDLKAGTAMFLPSQTHSAEIVGPGDLHVIIVELKDSAKMAHSH